MSDEVQVGQVWLSKATGDEVKVEAVDGRHVTHRGKRVVHTERPNFVRKYTHMDWYPTDHDIHAYHELVDNECAECHERASHA